MSEKRILLAVRVEDQIGLAHEIHFVIPGCAPRDRRPSRGRHRPLSDMEPAEASRMRVRPHP